MIDLNNIMRYHENNRIEAKKAAGGFPNSLWETYSAFANTVGGLILLGVEESRDNELPVSGVPDAAEYQAQLWQTVNDPTRVSANILSPEDVSVHTIEGKDVLVVHVPRANRRQRPVYIGDSPFSGTYRRDGEGDYHCSSDEIRAMLRDREDTPADLAVLENRSFEDLSPETLRQFRLSMVMRNPGHPWNPMPDRRFLEKAGAMGKGKEKDALRPTLAGLLLLGRRGAVREVFPRLRLIYREPDFSLNSVMSDGPENLYQFYTMVTARLSAVSSLLAQEPAERAELAGAMREAVRNAVLHADYFGKGGLTIELTGEGLKVTNGGLLRVDPAEIGKTGESDLRNRALTRLLSLIWPSIGAGKGLAGIYRVWDKRGWRAPVLAEEFKAGVTALSLPLPGGRITGQEVTREQVLEDLTDRVTGRPAEIARTLGLSPETTERVLRELVRDGLVIEKPEGYTLRA